MAERGRGPGAPGDPMENKEPRAAGKAPLPAERPLDTALLRF